MVTASRCAYLISPCDILQPCCKAGQRIRLICIADRVRFANSAFMIFRPELHCLWRLDKNGGKNSDENKKKKRRKDSEAWRTTSTMDFPVLRGRRFKRCLRVVGAAFGGLHLNEWNKEKGEKGATLVESSLEILPTEICMQIRDQAGKIEVKS